MATESTVYSNNGQYRTILSVWKRNLLFYKSAGANIKVQQKGKLKWWFWSIDIWAAVPADLRLAADFRWKDKVGNFHSLRHTYAKTALESGASVFWLSRHLGHSSPQVTSGYYGHWERAASRLEAEKVAFPTLPGARTDARTEESQATPTGGNGFGTHTDRKAAVLHAITTQPEAPSQADPDF